MAWIELTVDDVKERLTWPELEAFQTWHLENGQPDPVPGTIERVVREVRGFVGGCSRNTLGAGNTIPDELADAALSIIRWRLASRHVGAGETLLDEARKMEYEDARDLLKDVSRCRFEIQQPIDHSCDPGDSASNHSGKWGGDPYIQF